MVTQALGESCMEAVFFSTCTSRSVDRLVTHHDGAHMTLNRRGRKQEIC